MNIKVKIKVEFEKVIKIEAHDLRYRSIQDYVDVYMEHDGCKTDILSTVVWELEE